VTKVLPESDPTALGEASAAVSRGDLIVIPTDTVYGLAAKVDSPGAVARIFEAKGRPRDLAVPVLLTGPGQASGIGELNEAALVLAQRFWPGPLTIVVPRAKSLEADLGGEGTTVGLRAPNRRFALDLLADIGPLAATSANPSGSPTGASVQELVDMFGDAISVYIDGGTLGIVPSTVVSTVGGLRLIREGAIGWTDIRNVV
jgi:L-threonylcarbamoyladenylate synthase